jgi:hypothetical protein
MHEHGEWEVVGGGQAKVLRVVGTRGLRILKKEEVGVCGGEGT